LFGLGVAEVRYARLLKTSAEDVSARFEFDRAVRTARNLSDEEIAHLIGFSVAMIEAVAGIRRNG
jgi:hypothetical protein